MKKSSYILIFIFAIVGLLQTGCASLKIKCPRTDNVGFWSMDTELNKVFHCPLMSRGCTLSEFEVKDYFDLWTLATFNINNESFSITEQNDILQIARNKAVAEAPMCVSGQKKLVSDINFFVTIVTGNPPGYVIGMHVKYACCSGIIQQK